MQSDNRHFLKCPALSLLRLKPLILFFLVIAWNNTRAQRVESLKKHLADLLIQYHGHILSDTAYLKAVDSTAPLLLRDDSLQQLLTTYQQIAFSDKGSDRYQAQYYTYLAIYSYNMSRFGSAIYYSEKNNEERIKAGLFEKEGLSHADMFAVTVYFNNRDYARVFAKYSILRPALLQLPATIPSGKVSSEQAYVAFGILNAVVDAAYKTGDTVRANEGIRICEEMLEGMRKLPGKYKGDTTVHSYIYHTLRYEKEKYLNHFDQARDFLQMAIGEVRSGKFWPNLQPDYTEDIYADAFDFYFDHNKRDSAQHYLDMVRSLHDSLIKFSSMRQSFLLESNSKLLAAKGQFETAYHDLLNVYKMSDSSFYAVSADKDNNLYALAEAENTRNELLRMEAKQRQTERFSIILFSTLALLVFAGAIGFLLYRSGQQQRLLNLRLNLARNFHDEIGPMLLYANVLAKKATEAGSPAMLEELKSQIVHIMESVRSISHDLKSSELSTVGSFFKDVTGMLEKIRATTQIGAVTRLNNGSRVLSHLQHTHLRKVVNELISNSIKHAGCSMITMEVKVTAKHLKIKYTDNGKGMAPGSQTEGIGIQNIKERINLLNGDFHLHNAWPEGYSVDILIPLL
jgi:signal transduction histidine kinase